MTSTADQQSSSLQELSLRSINPRIEEIAIYTESLGYLLVQSNYIDFILNSDAYMTADEADENYGYGPFQACRLYQHSSVLIVMEHCTYTDAMDWLATLSSDRDCKPTNSANVFDLLDTFRENIPFGTILQDFLIGYLESLFSGNDQEEYPRVKQCLEGLVALNSNLNGFAHIRQTSRAIIDLKLARQEWLCNRSETPIHESEIEEAIKKETPTWLSHREGSVWTV